MKKLLILTVALIMCETCGAEEIVWLKNDGAGGFSKSTCNAGNNITRPADPTKTGYRFIGWQNTTATYNFASLPTNIVGTVGTYNSPQWSAVFSSFGTVYGTSVCSSVSGTYTCGDPNNKAATTMVDSPTNDGGAYCWCKVFAYVNNNGSAYIPTSSKWVYGSRYNGSYCSSSCAQGCAGNLAGTRFTQTNGSPAQNCRKDMFGVAH